MVKSDLVFLIIFCGFEAFQDKKNGKNELPCTLGMDSPIVNILPRLPYNTFIYNNVVVELFESKSDFMIV